MTNVLSRTFVNANNGMKASLVAVYGDDHTPQNDSEQVRALSESRRLVGMVDPCKWRRVVDRRDPVPFLKGGTRFRAISRAFFKLCEIHPLIAPKMTRVCRIMLLCEAPGGFWQACHHLWPDAHRVATSLEQCDISFHRDVPHEKGLPENGDICSDAVLDEMLRRHDAHTFDVVTADGGMAHANLEVEEQESLVMLMSQIIAGLTFQIEGGSFILKVFEGSTRPTQDCIVILRSLYQTVHLYKPRTSKCANSERYVIANNMLSQDAARNCVEWMKDVRRNLSTGNVRIQSLTSHACPEIKDACDVLARRQMRDLKMLMACVNTLDDKPARRAAWEDVQWIRANVPCMRDWTDRTVRSDKVHTSYSLAHT